MRLKKFKIDLFISHVFVFFDCKPKEVAKYVRKNLKGVPDRTVKWLENEDNAKNCGVCLSWPDSASVIIWLSKNPKTKEGQELLAHEATHAAFRMMHHWSIDVDANSQEILAMITGHIVKETIK